MIVTAADFNYLPRTLTLLYSIWQHMPDTKVVILCLDDFTFDKLNVRWGIDILYKTDVLNLPDRPAKARACLAKSFMLLKLLENCKDEWLIWLDSDMMLFSRLELPIGHQTLALTPHNYSSKFLEFVHTAGYYNAGFFGVNTTNKNRARKILEHWRDLCIEEEPESSTSVYDQKYLEFLAKEYGVNEIRNIGVNAAPWNISGYTVGGKRGSVMLNHADRLQLYHFQGMQVYRGFIDYYSGDLKLSKAARKLIYEPYTERLRFAYKALGIVPDGIPFRKRLKSYTFRSNIYDWVW